MNIQWRNQVVLLTGATGGIGQAIAKALDEKGAHIILTGRSKAKLEQLQQNLTLHHTAIVADITSDEGRDRVVSACQRLPLSILVNNAGITYVGEFEGTPVESIVSTNMLAPMLLTQRLLPLLERRPSAHVVNVGSAFGSIGFAAHGTYCATKFALKGWTEAMHREFSDSKIKFHYLAPRATRTDINDERANALNEALGNQTDEPDAVAQAFIKQLENNLPRVALGCAERFFAKLNALVPSVVDNALAKKLPTIKRYAFQKTQSQDKQTSAQNDTRLGNKLV